MLTNSRQAWDADLIVGILDEATMRQVTERVSTNTYSLNSACLVAAIVEKEINDRFMS